MVETVEAVVTTSSTSEDLFLVLEIAGDFVSFLFAVANSFDYFLTRRTRPRMTLIETSKMLALLLLTSISARMRD
jgi:hypothetical protein